MFSTTRSWIWQIFRVVHALRLRGDGYQDVVRQQSVRSLWCARLCYRYRNVESSDDVIPSWSGSRERTTRILKFISLFFSQVRCGETDFGFCEIGHHRWSGQAGSKHFKSLKIESYDDMNIIIIWPYLRSHSFRTLLQIVQSFSEHTVLEDLLNVLVEKCDMDKAFLFDVARRSTLRRILPHWRIATDTNSQQIWSMSSSMCCVSTALTMVVAVSVSTRRLAAWFIWTAREMGTMVTCCTFVKSRVN